MVGKGKTLKGLRGFKSKGNWNQIVIIRVKIKGVAKKEWTDSKIIKSIIKLG